MYRLPAVPPPHRARSRSPGALARLAQLARLCAALALAACCGAAQAAEDLAAHLAFAIATPALSATANLSHSTVTITNTSQHTIAAPFTLKVGPLAAPGVAVTHPDKVHYTLDVDINVALPRGVLLPGGHATVPIQFANPRRLPFTYAVSATGTVLSPQNSTPLTVTAWRYSGDAANPRGAPAGAGVSIVVDGVLRAVTDASSQATVQVPLGQQTVAARQPQTRTGIAHLALAAGGTSSVDVVMGDDGEVYAEAAFRFDETVQSVLPGGSAKLTGRFIAPDGSTVRLTQLAGVDAIWALTDVRSSDLRNAFELNADGTLRCTRLSQVASHAGRTPVDIVVTGYDADGNLYRGRAPLLVAGSPRQLALRPPSNAPALDLGGIPIVTRLGRWGSYYAIETTVTQADGSFTIPWTDDPDFEVSAHVVRDGQHYVASTAGGRWIGEMTLTSAATIRQEQYNSAEPPSTSEASLSHYVWDSSASDTVTPSTARLLVRQGTQALTLSYTVESQHIGLYQYNGWGLRVLAGPAGTVLFDTARAMRGAQGNDFIENSTITTGRIERQLDVSALTRDGDIEVFLQAQAAVTYYSYVVVNASLRPGGAFTIDAMTMGGTQGNSLIGQRHVSMPDSGGANLSQQRLRIVTGKPADAVITNVKVDLEWEFEGRSVTVLDGPPGPDALVDGSVIDALVTFRADPGTDMRQFRSQMPTQYRVTVTALAADGTTLTAQRYETARWPMWRAPASLPRYGMRDPGGDDWVSNNTLRWLEEHPDLAGRFGDFSGEHGNDLGHAAHGDGSAFDMYPFHTFAGADPDSGMSNYRQLVARILDLPKQGSTDPAQAAAGQAAAAEVKAWITASRRGIDTLLQAGAHSVAYILGGPDSAGIAGVDWGAKLLKTGRVTVGGRLFDLGTGSWITPYLPLANHHHHMHVTLQPDFYR